MLILEIVLEGQTLEDMEVVAEIMGVGLEILVVMACQHYIRWINENGFPRITGLYLKAEDQVGAVAKLGLGGPRRDNEGKANSL